MSLSWVCHLYALSQSWSHILRFPQNNLLEIIFLPTTHKIKIYQDVFKDKGVGIRLRWSYNKSQFSLWPDIWAGPRVAIPFHSASPSPSNPFQKRAEERGGHGERDGHAAVRAEPGGRLGRVEEGREGPDAKRQIQDETGRTFCWAGDPRPGFDGCWELHLCVRGPEDDSCFESQW